MSTCLRRLEIRNIHFCVCQILFTDFDDYFQGEDRISDIVMFLPPNRTAFLTYAK